MGTVCFPFSDDTEPNGRFGRKRLKTPIPINSAFLKGYDNRKIVRAYIHSINPQKNNNPPNDIPELCQIYFSDTFNV